LSPAETGEVMPLMISFMQSNLGAGMTGPTMPVLPLQCRPLPGRMQARPPRLPPACQAGLNPCRRRCLACSLAG